MITNNFESYNTAIYYFAKATDLIESHKHYPYGYDDLYESQTYLSVRAFVTLSNLYYIKYGKTVEGIFTTDTLEVLNNLSNISQRCLNRPALPIWGDRGAHIHYVAQTKCQSYLDLLKKCHI